MIIRIVGVKQTAQNGVPFVETARLYVKGGAIHADFTKLIPRLRSVVLTEQITRVSTSFMGLGAGQGETKVYGFTGYGVTAEEFTEIVMALEETAYAIEAGESDEAVEKSNAYADELLGRLKVVETRPADSPRPQRRGLVDTVDHIPSQ